MLKRICASVITLILFCFSMVSVSAADYDEITENVYDIDASLSCYINAMGGVEFGAPLLERSQINVAANGNRSITLYLTKSSVTIYGVTCDTFVDVSPIVVDETATIKNGTLGYYTESGELSTENLFYTISSDTAKNARDEDVHYVDSITFPVNKETETYYLTLYVNSNVMGTQFTKEKYPAVLTVDWSSVENGTILPPQETENENKDETDPTKETLQPDNRDGLNIYHADDEGETAVGTNDVSGESKYTAYLNKPLFIITLSIAALLVVAGVIVIIASRKDGKNEK